MLLLVLALLKLCSAVKVWQPCTDIGDVANWQKDRFPQTCDILDLSAAGSISMRLSGLQEGDFSGLLLPRDGVLRLPESTQVSFSADKQCRGNVEVAHFKRVSAKSWLDPSSWNYSVPTNKWLPHVGRIPCAGETVVFPPLRGFTILLPAVMVPVGPIIFGNKEYNVQDWSAFLLSEEGLENFKGAFDMRDLYWRGDKGCSPRKKCFCGRDTYTIRDWSFRYLEPKVLEESVCIYEEPRCAVPENMPCRSPIRPAGHCCDVCGAILDVVDKTADGLELSDLEKTVESELRDSTDGFRYYVGRKSDGNIQIVIMANSGDSAGAYDVAEKISQRMHSSLLGSKMTIALKHSGLIRTESVLGVTSAIFGGSFLFILGMFASVYYFNIVFPSHRWMARRRNFMFARFQNFSEDDAGVAVTTNLPSTDSFQNPLYQPDQSSSLPQTMVDSDLQEDVDVQLPSLPLQQLPTTALSTCDDGSSIIFSTEDFPPTALEQGGGFPAEGLVSAADLTPVGDLSADIDSLKLDPIDLNESEEELLLD